MWWAFGVLCVLLLPLLAFRGYAVVLTARALDGSPRGTRPMLASRLRMYLANVMGKVAIVALMLSFAVRDDPDGLDLFGWIAGGVVIGTMVWTLAEGFVGAAAAKRMDGPAQAYLDSLKAQRPFPWRRHPSLPAD